MVRHERIDPTFDRPVNAEGTYVLYWMTSARRTRHNASLERAVAWANRLHKPLVVLEAVSIDYPWASRRHHQFILQGMVDNHHALSSSKAAYYAYVERAPREGRGLFESLSMSAAVVVTDAFPCFFLPKIIAKGAQSCPCRFEIVDGNGVLPLALAGRAYPSAYAFRRYMQKNVFEHLDASTIAEPLSALTVGVTHSHHQERLTAIGIPQSVCERWPAVTLATASDVDQTLANLGVTPAVSALPLKGGERAAFDAAQTFVESGLGAYADRRNDPSVKGTSGLAPYFHFGHLSSVEVVHMILDSEPSGLSESERSYKGQRHGFWGRSEAAEGFLDQLITWRELGYGFCHHEPNYDQYETLPAWALDTLRLHGDDPRPHLYSPTQFENAMTHDPIWNAAQTQLVTEGRIHNYLRMLWGKKILHWSPSPQAALEIMVELNNKYALDGRNPNSYSGIFWVLGRFDRAWGPERSVFGKVRYMTSASTARKFKLGAYLSRYGQTLI